MAAGWHPDPYGRADLRYWDGDRWTEHVVRAGQSATDAEPFGGLPVVVEEQASTPADFIERLGPDARNRPAPNIYGALTAGGGALVAFGVFAVATQNDENRAGLIIGSLLLILAGYVLAALLPPVRPAAVTLVAVGLVIGVFAVFEDSTEDNPEWGLLVLIVLALAVYLAPVLLGRPTFLGIALTAFVALAAAVVADNDEFFPILEDDSLFESAYAVLLIIGVGYLVVAYFLDRAKYFGLATVFIAVAVVAVLAGAFGVGQEFDNLAGPLLVGAAGLALAVVGHLGRRRFTTWLGAAVVPSALLAAVYTVEDENATVIGIVVAVFGVALALVAVFLRRRDREAAADAL